jgi:hypothetical protein
LSPKNPHTEQAENPAGMKAVVASAGRFHPFDLARQMERLGN